MIERAPLDSAELGGGKDRSDCRPLPRSSAKPSARSTSLSGSTLSRKTPGAVNREVGEADHRDGAARATLPHRGDLVGAQRSEDEANALDDRLARGSEAPSAVVPVSLSTIVMLSGIVVFPPMYSIASCARRPSRCRQW